MNLSDLDVINLTPDATAQDSESNHGFMSLDKSANSDHLDSSKIGSFKYTTTGINRLIIPHSVDLKERERRLALREKEIAEKARELQQRFGYTIPGLIPGDSESLNGDNHQKGYRDGNPNPTRRTSDAANWPHPTWCPWIRHHIEEDIELHFQPLVRLTYVCWKLVVLGFVINIITIITAAFHANYYGSPQAASNALFSAVVCGGAAIPLSFVMWYMNLYRLCGQYSSTRWISFVLSFGLHGMVSVVMVLGMPWYPCAGVFFAVINIGTGHHLEAIMALLNTIVWINVVVLSTVIIRRARCTFSTMGQSMEEAQHDIRRDVRRGFGNALRSVVMGDEL